METTASIFLGFSSLFFLAVFITLVGLVVQAIRGKAKRRWAIALGLSAGLFMVTAIIGGVADSPRQEAEQRDRYEKGMALLGKDDSAAVPLLVEAGMYRDAKVRLGQARQSLKATVLAELAKARELLEVDPKGATAKATAAVAAMEANKLLDHSSLSELRSARDEILRMARRQGPSGEHEKAQASAGTTPPPVEAATVSSASTAEVTELAMRLSQKLDAADRAIARRQWQTAAGFLSEARSMADSASKAAWLHQQIVALAARQEELRTKIAEFDAQLFESLYQRVYVDEMKEPPGLALNAAADWDRREETRRTRMIAKKFGVSLDYADRAYQEGPLLERIKKDADLQRARDETQRTALRQKLAEKCGAVLAKTWSGVPTAVNDYLKEILHDPDSKKDLSCNGPWLTKDHCWVANCRFRAKNLLGAYVLSVQKFYISNNRVLHSESM